MSIKDLYQLDGDMYFERGMDTDTLPFGPPPDDDVDADDDVVSLDYVTSDNVTSSAEDPYSILLDPKMRLFGIVVILFILTVILALINFCIFYFEKRRSRGPLHWRSASISDVTPRTAASSSSQPPKRSFHIQHALYKSVRRPSSMQTC